VPWIRSICSQKPRIESGAEGAWLRTGFQRRPTPGPELQSDAPREDDTVAACELERVKAAVEKAPGHLGVQECTALRRRAGQRSRGCHLVRHHLSTSAAAKPGRQASHELGSAPSVLEAPATACLFSRPDSAGCCGRPGSVPGVFRARAGRVVLTVSPSTARISWGPRTDHRGARSHPPAAGRTAVCPRLGHERGCADREVKVELPLAHALRQRGVAGHRNGIGVHRPQSAPQRERRQLSQPLARLAPPRAHLVLVCLVLHCDLLLGSNHAQRHPRLQGRSSRPSLCHFDGTRARGSPP